MESFKVLVLCSLLFHFIPSFYMLETISPGQSVKDNETLVSAEGTFEAGFFNFGDPNIQYLGIWYKDISPRTIVWVANRDTPLIGNSSGVLNLTDGGNLVILNSTGAIIWSSNTSTNAKKPIVLLLDTGNLVVKEESGSENLIWQSFDLPGDTLLPGMKLRSNIVTGNYTSLISWRDSGDPASGDYSYYIDTRGFPQVLTTKGGKLLFRGGSWNGNILSGIPSETLYKSFNFSFVITEQEVSYGYELLNQSIVSKYMLTPTGQIQRFILSDQTKSWQLFLAGPVDQCDNYAICGANSNCDVNNSPSCECLQGFVAKSQENWNLQKWSDGCVRRVSLDCGNSDGFWMYEGMKLPDTSASWFNKSMNLDECKNFCLQNCSSGGQDLYIRVAASELATATNNFSMKNKLGEGGFGPVYKGTLTNGQDIAVKRLSNNSGQGPKEFLNEVVLIAKLQHRNLVKLLGCCIQDDEKLLIYEFMTNRSLDYFIFDQTRKRLLQWSQRFQIICGIARGLLYLHEDSRLRIIHRDLKTSNILLDENMNAKISDFGLARTFGDETEGNTKTVVGTYGYISPEYASRGFFSVKSDVFSFGVIVLEMVSGRKNREYFGHHDLVLLGHAWRLWCEERPLELIDEALRDSIALAEAEVLRCIHIGLLCVQERPEDRPDMSSVVLMLNGEKPLPKPREHAPEDYLDDTILYFSTHASTSPI